MKKTAVIAAGLPSLGCLGAFEIPTLGFDSGVRFSTERMFRGCHKNKRVFLPMIEVGLSVFREGRVCAGVVGVFVFDPFFVRGSNEAVPYVRLSCNGINVFMLNGGYTHRL